MARRSDEPALREVHLPDGGVLTLRAVAPSDVDALVALYDGLSEDDRYRRFFSGYRPPRSFYERLASVADRGGYGIVALLVSGDAAPAGRSSGSRPADGAGPRLVGEAGYELLPNGDGELGMTVAADQRGWLGPYLLDALAEAAAARGVPDLEADVLVTNGRMLALLRARGAASLPSDDWSTVRLVIGTEGHGPVWPGGGEAPGPADRPRVLVEVPGGRWHAQAEADEAGLQVVACPGPRGAQRRRCPVLAGRPCPLAAAADVIVAADVPDDDTWRRVVDAHAELHPGVPVCVERRGRAASGPQPGPGAGAGGTVDAPHDDDQLVAFVDRLAARHRAAGARRAADERDVRP